MFCEYYAIKKKTRISGMRRQNKEHIYIPIVLGNQSPIYERAICLCAKSVHMGLKDAAPFLIDFLNRVSDKCL